MTVCGPNHAVGKAGRLENGMTISWPEPIGGDNPLDNRVAKGSPSWTEPESSYCWTDSSLI